MTIHYILELPKLIHIFYNYKTAAVQTEAQTNNNNTHKHTNTNSQSTCNMK